MGNSKQASTKKRADEADKPASWMKVFIWSVVACAGVMTVWVTWLMLNYADAVNQFALQGWGQYAGVIVSNKIRALWHAIFMTICAAGALWWLLLSPKRVAAHKYAIWGLVLLVAGDSWFISRHYVGTMPLASMNENPVISILKQDTSVHRVALVTQEGFYNWWLTYLFPYYNIPSVNVPQMPRMPGDYRQFMDAVGRNPVLFWRLASVGYVLAPMQVWGQLQKDPAMKDTFDLIYSYNIVQSPEGVTVMPAALPNKAQVGEPSGRPGEHVVLRFKHPGPRYALFSGWERSEDLDSLHRFSAPTFVPFRKLLISSASATNLPPMDGEGVIGTVESIEYQSGFFHLRTASEKPSILRVAEKYDRDWQAALDGHPVPILRVDYIFQGLYIPPGVHDVILEYSPSRWPLFIQLSGLLACLGAGMWLAIRALLNRWR